MKQYTNDNRQNGLVASPVRPAWLDDEVEVVVVLNDFLDKLDKQPASERVHMPRCKLHQKNTPKLYNHDEASDRTWNLIQSLSGLIYEIMPNRKRSPYDAEYVGTSLVMIPEGEEICREWLGRPVKKHYREEWALAIETHRDKFSDNLEEFKYRPVRIRGKSAEAVVAAFVRIADFINSELTLRQLSARCFWGNSKVLDAREGLLHGLFPDLRINPRPVIVHVQLPVVCKGVLFIENQDTYIQALAGVPEEVNYLTVVYVAGFRGSAERVRESDGVSLHYHGTSNESLKQHFESWWFDNSTPIWPIWFWGDLDYSGMAILKVLRQRFNNVQAWPEGYAPLCQLLKGGGGHSPENADKSEQKDPVFTGCLYADEELLPMLRSYGRFVDQEYT